MTAQIAQIAYGPREAMQAEYGVLPCYIGPFLVLLLGTGSFDPVECRTASEAAAEAKLLAAQFSVPLLHVA